MKLPQWVNQSIYQSINLSPHTGSGVFFLFFFLPSFLPLSDLFIYLFFPSLKKLSLPESDSQPRQVSGQASKQPSRISNLTQNEGSRSHPHMPKGKEKKRDTQQSFPHSLAGGGSGGGPHIFDEREVFIPVACWHWVTRLVPFKDKVLKCRHEKECWKINNTTPKL